MFTFLEGTEPPEDHLVESFGRLGEVAARMHLHSRSWSRPAGFKRPTWNFESMLGGPRPIWGRWQDGIGLDPDREKLLGRLMDTVARRLERFGSEREQFGLVHADLRLANLLIEGDQTKVIDFDDCGFGWYLYDLSTALTFIEERADVQRTCRRVGPQLPKARTLDPGSGGGDPDLHDAPEGDGHGLDRLPFGHGSGAERRNGVHARYMPSGVAVHGSLRVRKD